MIETKFHPNGSLKSVCKKEAYQNYENEADSGKEVNLQTGAFVTFDDKGKVKEIGQYSTECLQGTISNPGRFIWQSSLVWSKTFDVNGKVEKAFGRKKDFPVDGEMLKILKKHKLWYAVGKALSAKKGTALKSILTHSIKQTRSSKEIE